MSAFLRVFVLFAFLCLSNFIHAIEIEKLADDDWLHLQSENFDVLTDLDEEKGRHLIENLEAYRHFCIQMMGLKVLDNIKPLKLLAISSSSNFRKLALPDNWLGVFGMSSYGYAAIANVQGYKADSNSSTVGRQVLFHEYNHFLVRFTEETRNFPTWYDEGYADYWGTFKFTEEKIFIGSEASIRFREGDLFSRTGDLNIDTEKLFKATKYPDGKEETSKFYAQAFFAVHYFNSSPELRALLGKYINFINLGYSEDDALNKSFAISFRELDKRIKKYVANGLQMRVIGTKNGNLNFPKKTISVAKVEKAEFYRLTTEVLANISTFDNAIMQPILQKTIELNPQYVPAKAQMLIRNYSQDPKKAVEELEKLAPNDPTLLTYKGRSLLGGADLLRAAGFDNWLDTMKQARGFFRKAIKGDSSLGAAYLGLGDVYNNFAATETLQEGIVGFETGSLFDREESVFLKLSLLYIRTNKESGALVALRNAIAFSDDKVKFTASLPLENLELLNTLTTEKIEKTSTGLIFSGGTIYTGTTSNNVPNGEGKLERPNKTYFEGTFAQGVMEGHGKIITHNGFVYDGDFKKGIASGKAKITFPENFPTKSYEGEVDHTFPNGKGILEDKNGIYEGEFWYGLRNGKGTFTASESKVKFTGTWTEGRYQWPAVGDIQFIGDINTVGQRDGKGVCKNLKTNYVEWCVYKDGVVQQDMGKTESKK